jgi:Tol biopolymer transport system component
MYYAGNGVIGYWLPLSNIKEVVGSFPGYGELYIGPWEGNLSLDGSIIAVSGTAPDGTEVVFAYDLVKRFKYPDIKVSNFGNTFDWASISPKGGYVVMFFSEDDHTAITDLRGNLLTKFPAGHPSHYDMTVDANGQEVAVGKAVYSPVAGNSQIDGGKIMKVRLADGAITQLTTGGYGRHSSTRDTTSRIVAVSSFEPDASHTYGPYNGEIALVNLDGSAVYRLAHHNTIVTDYEAEAIPSISPDGTRVIFSSNWNASSGRPVQVYVIDLRGVCTPSP